MAVALQRLRKEFVALQKQPLDKVRAMPWESNILEWHYVLEGPVGSPFEGGFYHGTVTFPTEYPFKPPSIMMLTPNGRFETNVRLCLSMSDFHPESWNPVWSVGTILMGLYSFMLEEQATAGSVSTTAATKRRYATESLEHNSKNAKFAELFPDLQEVHVQRVQAAAAAAAARSQANPGSSLSSTGTSGGVGLTTSQTQDLNLAGIGIGKGAESSMLTILGVLAALLAAAYIIVRQVVV